MLPVTAESFSYHVDSVGKKNILTVKYDILILTQYLKNTSNFLLDIAFDLKENTINWNAQVQSVC